MKEEINLLPPKAQHVRMRGLYAKRVRSIFSSLVTAMVVVGVGYGGAYGVLYWTYLGVSQSLESSDSSIENTSKQTTDINEKIRFAHRRLVADPPWTPLVVEALQAVPGGIVITEIETSSAGKTLTMSGTSDSRATIVRLEQALRELSWAQSVEAPLQNFASGPNVTFRFTIQRKTNG